VASAAATGTTRSTCPGASDSGDPQYPARRTSDPARRRPDPAPVAGGGEGATRFPAWRRWEAGGKREVGGANRRLLLPASSPPPPAATGGGLGAEAAAATTKGGLGVSGGEVDRRRR